MWNVENKLRKPDPVFWGQVEEKVARSADVGGWSKGPVSIASEQADEAIDIPAWGRGYDLYPKPAGADELIREIGEDSEALFRKILRLKELYE